ncbi:rhamnulokinase [Stackebrandtia nassauensis]|uniref:Carbohydrate kinase FGGY n=1 Tax=Stackebrandtia nassauensis (strain DSM 44728 / CIP 108903 / NRRL B-16338 / NBRC 102104 / LLR-40K-21) TaxID=446470 RepID=D3PXN2_STANL|nr:rhamnulokinase family protein [Stackebrandtia nassauensis]ADD43362.1 carbohydrate kinase FGGY [Stackebrandtia nassauensis DSM 44728]
MTQTVAAVDLGATSGRVMLGHFASGTVNLETVSRFPNGPVDTVDGLHWNVLELYRCVVDGLRLAARARPGSVGVDSWAVDYALLRGGRVLGFPYHYRDSRNQVAAERAHRIVPPERMYRESGLQFLPFNTVYQLVAEQDGGLLDVADRLLLIPDLIGYLLSGEAVTERTNASTTGLIDIASGKWNRRLLSELSIPERILTDVVDPGTSLGPVRSSLGLDADCELVTVGSHDTASAVVAVPAVHDDVAYISSGTWSLVGLELPQPVVTEASRAANFTNEAGVDGRVRFLRNVSGLWLLDEMLRHRRDAGEDVDLAALLDAAAAVDSRDVVLFDTDDPRFLPPGDHASRIVDWCREHDVRPPEGLAELTRAILESLAEAYARTLRQASELSGKAVTTVHIVGGGSRNRLLCQLTADRTGLPVLAGPVEATALGNVLVQARALGIVSGSLEALRALVAASVTPVGYQPGGERS